MMVSFDEKQTKLCARFGVPFVPTPANSVLGISKGFITANGPIHGLRHAPEGQTSGWYIWAGQYSESFDFFEPMHASHLEEICPRAMEFLGLAPGWRFLFDNNYEDVWFDEKLLPHK
jgi:hypothetical protein